MMEASSTGEKTRDRPSAIAEVLQQNILSGHYAPGDRLPSEADLCAHFNVSRPTLREALGRLSANGLIQSRRGAGGGAFVTRPEPDALCARVGTLIVLSTAGPAQRRMLLDARLQLEIGCARLGAGRRADISDIRAEIDRQSDFTISDRAFRASCRRMHLALAATSDNTALTVLTQSIIEAEYSHGDDMPCPTRARARYLSFHVRIANGIGAGRADDSESALNELWSYESEREDEREAGAAPMSVTTIEVERPPRMRDLRIPPVQRFNGETT